MCAALLASAACKHAWRGVAYTGKNGRKREKRRARAGSCFSPRQSPRRHPFIVTAAARRRTRTARLAAPPFFPLSAEMPAEDARGNGRGQVPGRLWRAPLPLTVTRRPGLCRRAWPQRRCSGTRYFCARTLVQLLWSTVEEKAANTMKSRPGPWRQKTASPHFQAGAGSPAQRAFAVATWPGRHAATWGSVWRGATKAADARRAGVSFSTRAESPGNQRLGHQRAVCDLLF